MENLNLTSKELYILKTALKKAYQKDERFVNTFGEKTIIDLYSKIYQ